MGNRQTLGLLACLACILQSSEYPILQLYPGFCYSFKSSDFVSFLSRAQTACISAKNPPTKSFYTSSHLTSRATLNSRRVSNATLVWSSRWRAVSKINPKSLGPAFSLCRSAGIDAALVKAYSSRRCTHQTFKTLRWRLRS